MLAEQRFDVFLSYNSKDETWAKRLKTALVSRTFKVWLACDEILPGEQFPAAIERGMKACNAIALIVSPESLASGWVQEEYNTALVLIHKSPMPVPLIPVLLRTAELPPFLSTREFADFRDESAFDAALDRLAAGLTAGLGAEPRKVRRVTFISSEYPPRIFGGLGIHVQKLTTALASHLDLDVMLPDPGDSTYQSLADKVHTVTVPVTAAYDDPASWVRFAEYAAAKLANLEEKARPDVIHCHDWVTVMAGIKCKWLLNIPLVFHVHLPNRSPLCASIENLGLVCADMVTVNSEAMFVELNDRRLPIRQLQIVKNGVDTDVFRPAAGWPSDGGYILFTGRLVEQKGVEYLLRAFNYVLLKFPDVRLKIVGDGEFKEWLERLAENLMLSSYVEFIPWIQHEDLAQVYQEARIVVVPSVFEPFGMVALEAMACKRPVVASRTGGLKEIVQHPKTGFLAEPKDHLDLAQWVMTLLSDSELRRRMGEAGHARVTGEGYTWPAIAEQFMELYRQLIEAPPDRKEPSEGYVYLQQILSLAPKSEYYDWSRFMGRLFSKD